MKKDKVSPFPLLDIHSMLHGTDWTLMQIVSVDSHTKFKFLMMEHVNRLTQYPHHEFIYPLCSYAGL